MGNVFSELSKEVTETALQQEESALQPVLINNPPAENKARGQILLRDTRTTNQPGMQTAQKKP